MKATHNSATKDRLLKALNCAHLHNVAPVVALEIISTYDNRVTAIKLDDLDSPQERKADEIDCLYRELRELQAKAFQDPSLEVIIAEKLSRLRRLQAEEASEMRQRFQARLPFEPGAGRKLIEEAKRLLADDHTST